MSITVITALLIIGLTVLALWAGIAAYMLLTMGPVLGRLWREPVFRFPILVFESDDWGTGPLRQGMALKALRQLLQQHSDIDGRPAHMSLALVLGEADPGPSWPRDGDFGRRALSDSSYEPVLEQLKLGETAGVFSLQLHCGEHFNPAALREALIDSPQVRGWFESGPGAATEDLPAALQTRWAHCAELPSKPLLASEVNALAISEVEEFRSILGRDPRVAVPPTFIWTDAVEAAWASAGVHTIITPGRRYIERDASGLPAGDAGPVFNGEVGRAGLTYLVRDIYFEPSFGHTSDAVLPRILERQRERRPALLETHRVNFVASDASCQHAIEELDRLLGHVKEQRSDVVFLSPEQIAAAIRERDPAYLDNRALLRIAVFAIRASRLPRLGRLLRFSGLVFIASAVEGAFRSHAVYRDAARGAA